MSAYSQPRPGRARPPIGHSITFLFVLVIGMSLGLPRAQATTTQDLFRLFTQHIRKQVVTDKQAFAEASRCTQWFYKRQKQKPPRPQVEGVVRMPPDQHPRLHVARSAASESDCDTLYPRGLDAVREAFSRTQSTLSLSLTFYEFALVSDGNDDGEYNATELRDVLRSLDLASDQSLPAETHLAALTDAFDSLHRTLGLDRLMASMSRLYDHGYRFTGADQTELHRVME